MSHTAATMNLRDALQALADARREEVVVSTMGALREWNQISRHRLDLCYIPSAMGHAPMLGLGVALARPDRHVIVLNGDGCMLMSLGCLVTIAASGAQNYTLLVVDNGIYEVTGGQATAARTVAADYAALALAAGFGTAERFEQLNDWRARLADFLRSPGPRLVHLRVAPVAGDYQLPVLGPVAERLSAFSTALSEA